MIMVYNLNKKIVSGKSLQLNKSRVFKAYAVLSLHSFSFPPIIDDGTWHKQQSMQYDANTNQGLLFQLVLISGCHAIIIILIYSRTGQQQPQYYQLRMLTDALSFSHFYSAFLLFMAFLFYALAGSICLISPCDWYCLLSWWFFLAIHCCACVRPCMHAIFFLCDIVRFLFIDQSNFLRFHS